jgi:hypothetical protein
MASEEKRQRMARALNATATVRENLEALYGQVWSAEELKIDFEIRGFAAPYVVVFRRSDHKSGSLMFQNEPRFYFSWAEEE